MTKAPTPTEMSKGQWQHKQRHKKVRLNSGCGTDLGRSVGVTTAHPTGVVYRFYRAHLPTHHNSYVIEGKNMQIFLYIDIKIVYI